MWNAGLNEIKIAGRNNNLRYAGDNHSKGRKWKGTKELLDEGDREKWKSWFKTQKKTKFQKAKIMASSPITSWQIDGGKWKQWQISFSWAPKSLWIVTAATKLKDTCPLEEKLWQT